MQILRRYWVAGLILFMVAGHAIAIGYVRNRVAQLSDVDTNAFEMGDFRFQTINDLETVYHFRLHAVIDPARLHRGRERLTAMRMEIFEATEQLLRQCDPQWLEDPTQSQIRERLMEIVRSQLNEPLVHRLIITNWLKLPVDTVAISSSGAQST